MVASTAASTDSPVIRHISTTYTSTPTRIASAAEAPIAASGCPEKSDAVANSPYAPIIISSPCASESTRLTR